MRIITVGIDDLDLGSFANFTQAVEAGLDQAASEIQGKFLEPTRSWDRQPNFSIDREPLKRTIGTDDQLYAWLNEGTRERDIFAKPGRVLKIQPRSSKTTPFNFTGRDGGSSGEVYYAKKVHIKGIEPRGWDELIEYIYSSEFSGGGRLSQILQERIDQAKL